jgi:undecaprenyl-diphosphatase
MDYIQAILIAIVEGLTEFLPVSSTGHMIIAQKLLGVESTDFVKLFTVNIQFGAILSVIIIYWKRFVTPLSSKQATQSIFTLKGFEQKLDFYLKLLVAFLPAAFFGLLLKDYIDSMLENVVVVAVSLVAGGVILLFVDKWFHPASGNSDVSYPKALKIGFFQVISMIPGVSRSAATIIGGLSQKLDRKSAAEFSFFLAVPTMLAATALELLQTYKSINTSNIGVLLLGNLVAFIVAILAIKGFIAYLTKYGFKAFGYYRIAVGLIILILVGFGVDLNIIG